MKNHDELASEIAAATMTGDWYQRREAALRILAAHWPAGGAVTGRAIMHALNSEDMIVAAANGQTWGANGFYERLDRAAARLSAQPVAFDVEAVSREISEDLSVGMTHGAERAANIAAILRRHAAAPAVGVVEVTAQDVADSWEVVSANRGKTAPTDPTTEELRAEFINARLRARAGTATPNSGAASSSVGDAAEMAERFADDHQGTPGTGTREFARAWFVEHWPRATPAGQTTGAQTTPPRVTAEHVRRVRAMLAALGDDVTNTEATDELIATAYNYMQGLPPVEAQP